MWLSKSIGYNKTNEKAEKGSITLSSSRLETGATVNNGDIDIFAPYGYQSVPPTGEEVIIIPSSDGQVTLGSISNTESLESGEIRLRSKGGATILLRNDGSVVINSLVIDKNGVIQN